MPVDEERARGLFMGAGRVIGALLIAYSFMLVLITASLQTSVSERLGRLSEPLDFNTGYATWRDAQDNRAALAQLRQRERELIARIDKADSDREEALIPWTSEMETADLLMQRLGRVRGCELQPDRSPERLTAIGLISELRACRENGALTDTQRSAIEEALGQSDKLLAADAAYRGIDAQAKAAQTQLERVQRAIASLSALVTASREVSNVFGELSSFTEGRLPFAGPVGTLPPAVVHILLAFVSGLFGALLVTLVLVVYPGNNLKLTSSGGYGERIFLGGLISICVFVVLGGGTAVLGTSEGFGSGEANFLAFCAVGILAGMFSDRVAQWLSGRADAFFGDRQADHRGPADDRGHPATP